VSLASLPTLLFVPPLNLLPVAIVGAALRRWRVGRVLLWTGLLGLWLFALPIVSGGMMQVLESGLRAPPPLGAAPPGPPAQAVVILSGDQQAIMLPTGVAYRVGLLTLEREQAGAALAKATGLPVLVTGGAIHPWSQPLADMMIDSLRRDFGVTVQWREAGSQDTWENARRSAAILRGAGISRVWVVTHAWHMKRALVAFRRAGLQALAAPVVVDAPPRGRAAEFLPTANGWLQSYFAMHELIGWAWYDIRP
jgi:uncharacterized SAM-binding protein YcdF (DUF218 family)